MLLGDTGMPGGNPPVQYGDHLPSSPGTGIEIGSQKRYVLMHCIESLRFIGALSSPFSWQNQYLMILITLSSKLGIASSRIHQ
ncbi:hypothetical protein DPMN_181168 [Dreissena polymorpha]|uniref:Uncharacterized protein n=1 Tax=Dreissena polymorpha TaxID=45954 RepID=A0A9D4I439_DREPO|nr:hypothetical protein DPMN_181168 [Dreissena polymorpha]